jgi:hypothetical protein
MSVIRHKTFRNALGLGQLNLPTLGLRCVAIRDINNFTLTEDLSYLADIPAANRPDPAVTAVFQWTAGSIILTGEYIELGPLTLTYNYLGVAFYLTDPNNTLVVSQQAGPGFPPRPYLGRNRLRVDSGIVFSI